MLALAGANEPTPDTWLKSNVDVIFLAFRPIPFHSQFVCILYVAVFVSGSVFVAPMGERVRACVYLFLYAHDTRYTIAKPHHTNIPCVDLARQSWIELTSLIYTTKIENELWLWNLICMLLLAVILCLVSAKMTKSNDE